LIDEASRRNRLQFANSPVLMHLAAYSLKAQGKTDEADLLSEQAYKLTESNAEMRLMIALALSRAGLFDAAEHEFRETIKTAPQETREAIQARYLLSEMLHEQQRDLAAAEVLQTLVTAMEKDDQIRKTMDETVFRPEVISKMHYFYACHFESTHDRQKQREHLELAIAKDPGNVDVLIAMYHESADDAARRQSVLEKIRAVHENYHRQIINMPIEANTYNDDAWLIGNTEGDFDQAVAYSHKSLELTVNWPGNFDDVQPAEYLDTLAHCYAAKKDFESAVRYQNRAAELQPHSPLIVRALDQFKTQLQETRKPASGG
ncbi:MAG TPA: hypothetical protein VGJ15_05065, partial [Pirellulales bacterium]